MLTTTISKTASLVWPVGMLKAEAKSLLLNRHSKFTQSANSLWSIF